MKLTGLKILASILACSLFFIITAQAQEDIPDRTEKSISKKASKGEKKKRKPGFFFGSSGTGYRWHKGRYEIRLGGFLQVDSRTFFDDSAGLGKDNVLLRRIQPSLELRYGKTYSFYIMPSFVSTPGILDVYLEGNFTKHFNIRTGKFKPPFGLERLQSATALAFNERAFPTNLAPNRAIGAQIFGAILWDTTEYQIGLFSGAIDNSSGLRGSVINSDNSGIDFVARLFSHPLKYSGIGFIEDLGFGVAYSYGTQQGSLQPDDANLPAFISPGQQLIASYAPGAFAQGSRERIGPQLYYRYGPFAALGEYTISRQNIQYGAASHKVTNEAFQVQLSWILFNGEASFRRLRPSRPLTLENISTWGAVQLVTRYSELNLDDAAFTYGLFNSDTSVKKAQDFGVGINWYLNRNVKFQLDYNQIHFARGAQDGINRPEEKVLFSRIQLAF